MTDIKIPDHPAAWDDNQSVIDNAKHVQGEAIGLALGNAMLWLGRSFKAASHAVQTWRRNQKAMSELAQCSDWMLADIGIRRDEIRQTVRSGVERTEVVAANPAKPAVFSAQASNDTATTHQAARKVA